MAQTKRLLLLDDGAAVAYPAALIAESAGYEVSVGNTPEEFFLLLADWEPSHIAIDLVMSTLDGIEVLRLLAVLGCGASIIIMGGIDTKVLESAQRCGYEEGLRIAGILQKPYSAAKFLALLDNSPGSLGSLPGVAVFPDMRMLTQADFMEAVKHDQFALHYQPQINMTTGEVVGFEALVRWQHPQHGLIFPDAFIPLAEKSEGIIPLTYRIISLGVEFLAGLSHGNTLSLALNISSLSLKDLELVDRLSEACTQVSVEPRQITLEITETGMRADSVVELEVLTRLRLRGFHLAIDDFGVGYSSLEQLARVPFSVLKIDKSFVMSMMRFHESKQIVKSLIHLSRSLGLTTIAEGVENIETVTMLRAMGCELAQGHYFQRAMEVNAAKEWLRDWNERLVAESWPVIV